MSADDRHTTRILVVDDNDRVRDAMCSRIRLSSERYRVDGVRGGAEALERLAEEEIDIVLCDLVLAGERDGIETTREILEHHPGTRVVVFSGAESGDRKVQVLKTGAFSYHSKPINYAALLHAITTIDSIRRTERLGHSFRILAQISHELQMSFDADVLARRVVEGARELGFIRSRLYVYDDEREMLEGRAASGMADDDAFVGYEVPFAAHPMLAELFHADRPQIWNERRIVEHYGGEATDPWMDELELRGLTWIDLPLLVGNERIGTLAVDHGPESGEARYGGEDLEILGVLAGMAAQALNNARIYEKEALANASLSSILRDAPDAVITTDLDGDINFVSPSAERLTGLPADKLVGQPAHRFFVASEDDGPDSGERLAREIRDRLAEEKTISHLRIDLRPGPTPGKAPGTAVPRPALASFSLLHDDTGEAIGVLAIVKDAEGHEGQSEQYRDVLEGFGYGTLLLSRRGNVQFVNRKASRLLRRRREVTVGRRFTEMVLPGQRDELEKVIRRVLSKGDEATLDLSLLRGDAGRLAVSARLTPVRSRRGRTGVAVALYDKGELGALIQSGRLMALGQMVAGVAHEINNPLNNLLVALREMGHRLEREELLTEKNRRYVEMIERNGERIRGIVQSLRDFARPTSFEKVELDLNAVIDDALDFFRTRFRHHDIDLDVELADDLPSISGDAGRLQQVFVNLIVNAEEAMETQSEPRRLRIRSRRVETPGVPSESGPIAEVEIEDTGPGIPDEIIDAVFDPFFTTKAPNQGTGLGLSITKSIVDLHAGEIRVGRGADGRGARFVLRFEAVVS